MKRRFFLYILSAVCLLTACAPQSAASAGSAVNSEAPSAVQSTPAVDAGSSLPESVSSESEPEEKVLRGYIGDNTSMNVISVTTTDGCSYLFRRDDVFDVMQGNAVCGAAVTIAYDGELTPNDADSITVTSFVIGSEKLPQTPDGLSMRTVEGDVTERSHTDYVTVTAGNGKSYRFYIGDDAEIFTAGGDLKKGDKVRLTYTGDINQYAAAGEVPDAGVTVLKIEVLKK